MYDLAIIGAGPAGFAAAQQAVKSGLKVVLIEKDRIGGTCLNRGCIPTKALIQSAKVYTQSQKSGKFGVEIPECKINFTEIQNRKDSIVSQLGKGMQFLIKEAAFLQGHAQFISNEELVVDDNRVRAKNILISTGSRHIQLPNFRFDGNKIISSDSLLDTSKIPDTLLIIGGGVIGCEFASLFSAFGTKVTIVELMPQILPLEDKEIAKKLELCFRKKGIKVNTGTDATTMNLDDYERALLCIGRTPDQGNLDLGKIGIQTERNRIITDEFLNTNVPNIFAAGDCTGSKLLAHFASHQGAIAVRNIINARSVKQMDPDLIPGCIFTDPEIASVGIAEDKAKGMGIDVKVSKFDFLSSGMARIIDETEGFIKVVSNKSNGDILGVSIIGPKAAELISSFTVAVQLHLNVSHLRSIVFAHPTLSESIQQVFEE